MNAISIGIVTAPSSTSDLRSEVKTTPDVTILSVSERRVASLAVRGYTNRDIAAQLHLTVSTVEQHLTRTFRKLKISRRWDLPNVDSCRPTDLRYTHARA